MNVDLKLILIINATLQYISKYTSKLELCSEAFSKILTKILAKSDLNDSLLTVFQILLLHTVTERDILV